MSEFFVKLFDERFLRFFFCQEKKGTSLTPVGQSQGLEVVANIRAIWADFQPEVGKTKNPTLKISYIFL